MRYRLLNSNEIHKLIEILNDTYPVPKCGLDFESPFELMLSLILAAQCTDIRVNKVRPILTNIYKTPEEISKASYKDIYNVIKSCSFPNNKAHHIVEACKMLVSEYNSSVPNSMEELVKIPGIGRKSANIILSEGFGIVEGIAVDTHVTRLSKKIGLTNSTDVKIIEKDLMRKIPKNMWSEVNHILVEHGKNICIARKPKCELCTIQEICREFKKIKYLKNSSKKF